MGCEKFSAISHESTGRGLALAMTQEVVSSTPDLRQVVYTRAAVPCTCTADLVGLWPVSDEVSPLSSVLEQS